MTTAPEAKRRLIALLRSRAPLEQVHVTYGSPTSAADARHREMVFLGTVQAGEFSWAALGNLQHAEAYTIELVVYVRTTHVDEVATEKRCGELYAECVDAIKSDPSLDSLLARGVEMVSGTLDTLPISDPNGWRSRAAIELRCEALRSLS
jgi:hypothetical protein